MKILIRTDSSQRIGSGHLMRCLTLADALRRQGCEVHFISRPHPGHNLRLIEQAGYPLLQLPLHPAQEPLAGYQNWLGCTEQQDARDCLTQLKTTYQWLIVDHYGLAANFCQQLRSRCQRVMVIDDLANRTHDCELLLDQNLLPNYQQRYAALLPNHSQALLGPEFALLREEFYQPDTVQPSPGHILVFFGGSDPYGLTRQAVDAILALQEPAVTADIVIGEAHPERQALQQRCASSKRLELHVQCQNMAHLMRKARLMLGAGGSTHWERCISALPALVVTVADNQVATTRHLQQLGACHWLGPASEQSAASFKAALSHWLSQEAQLKQMGQCATRLVPKSGGTRAVVRHLLV